MKKRIVAIATVSTVLGLLLGGYTLANTWASTDSPTTIQGVNEVNDHQQSQLDNHEARISNTENDVSGLQQSTNTPQSSNRVTVPGVTPPPTSQAAPDVTPPPTPVTVASYEQLSVPGSEDIDCKLTYTDGSTHTWRWKTVTYNQGTATTQLSGRCDPSIIGQAK